MNPDQRRYILENINKKSIKEISQELGLRDRHIKKFLEKNGITQGADTAKTNSISPVIPAFKESLYAKTKYSKLSETLFFLGIILIAFLIRWLYLNQIRTSPFFVPFYHGLDDYLYDEWAQNIANGDIIGKGVFYGLPLYPYFLGFIYFLFGHSVFIAKTAQFFIGSLNCGLIYLLGRKIFNRPIGVMAALMFAFHDMAIYFEGFFVSAFLAIFINLIIALVLVSIKEKPSLPKWAMAGFLIGLASLASASIFLLLPFLIYWAITSLKGAPKNKIVAGLIILFIGVFSAILPVTVRNYVVGKDLVFITSHSGITFYGGNNPLSDGSFYMPQQIGASVIGGMENAASIAQREMKRQLKPSEVSRFWFKQSLGFMRAEPYKFLKLMVKKAFLFWNAYEIPDILPKEFFQRYSAILRTPLFNLSFILPFSILGMILCLRSKRAEVALLYFFVTSVFLSTVVYFVNSRYRLIAVPYQMIFAAAAIFWLYVNAINKKVINLAAAFISVILLLFLTHVKMLEFRMHQAHNNLGIILKRQGLFKEAVAEYKKAFELDPRYDTPRYNLGLLYRDQGDYEQALNSFEETLKVNPHFFAAHNKMAEIYSDRGQTEKALLHWKKSLEINPDQPDLRGINLQ